jgi:hypothetical protein
MRLITLMILLAASSSLAATGGGNVKVQSKSGNWSITGDAQPNHVIITQQKQNTLRVTGAASNGGTTTINQQAYVDIPANTNISVQLGDGDDRLEAQGSGSSRVKFGGGLTVNLGGGVDTVLFENVSVAGTCDLYMGNNTSANGYETVILTYVDTGNLSYATDRAKGANTFNLGLSSVRGNLTILSSDSSDSVNVSSSTVGGNLYARLGNESNQSATSDSFGLFSATVSGTTKIEMGEGRGLVNLNNVHFGAVEVFFGAYKSDSLIVNSVSANSARFDGSSGSQDRISGSSNIFSNNPDIRGFEQNYLAWKNR